jgi:hypothetical protein
MLQTPNLAAGRGDVIKVGKHRSVVVSVEWRDPTWAVTYRLLTDRGTRLSVAPPLTTFLKAASAPSPEGRWVGELTAGSKGHVDLERSRSASESGTLGSTVQSNGGSAATNEGEATMASKTIKRTVKTGAKSKTTANKAANGKRPGRKPASKLTEAQLKKAAKMKLDGSTWNEIRESLGVKTSSGTFQALWDAAGIERPATRERGAAKPAGKKAATKATADDAAPDAAETAARKAPAKKVTRRATKADPSKKG